MKRGISPIVAAVLLLIVSLAIAIIVGSTVMKHASSLAPEKEKRIIVSCIPLNESLWLCVIRNELGKHFSGNITIAAKNGMHVFYVDLKPRGYRKVLLKDYPLSCSAETEICRFHYGRIVIAKPTTTTAVQHSESSTAETSGEASPTTTATTPPPIQPTNISPGPPGKP